MKNSTANYKIMYSNRLNVKNMCSSKMINIDSFICWISSLYQIDFTYLGLEKTFMSYFRYNIQQMGHKSHWNTIYICLNISVESKGLFIVGFQLIFSFCVLFFTIPTT